jgi:hypothetical protein
MGRKQSKNVKEKRKAVMVRPIERKHGGKVTEPYRLMEASIKAHHPELEPAKIILLWRKGWKPDVDKVLALASIKKASDLDHAIAAMVGDGYDFAMQLNEEAWAGLSDAKKTQVVDHELCHAAPDLDRDGNQKLDAKDRLCWRLRKHPIQEFPEIIQRYGAEECLGLNAMGLQAVEDADRPLLKAAEQAGNFRSQSVDDLLDDPNVKAAQVAKLHKAGLDTLGELADLMEREATWWHKSVPGIGKDTAAPIEDALAVIRGAC